MRRHLKLWLFAVLVSAFQSAHGEPESPLPPFDGVCHSGTTHSYHALLTGTEDGYYYKVGRAIALVAYEQCKQGLSPCVYVCAEPRKQTLNNFHGLAKNEADFAIVQGDVAHDAWFGHPLSEKSEKKIDGRHVKLVTPLYVEAVHILLRPHLNITTLEGLRGKRVWLGPSESSTEYTARRVLRSAGLNPNPPGCENFEHEPDEHDAMVVTCIKDSAIEKPGKPLFESALVELNSGRIDALFKIAPVPSKDIRDTLLPSRAGPGEASESASTESNLRSDFQLLPFDYSLAHQYAQSGNGGYVEKLIQTHAYQQEQSALTIGVPAFLLTRLEADQDVARLAQLVRENRKSIEARVAGLIQEEEEQESGKFGHGHPFSLDLVNVSFPTVPLHDLAIPPQHIWQEWPWLLLGFAAVFPPLWVMVNQRRRKMPFNLYFVVSALGHSVTIALALLLLSCFGGALWLQSDERTVNEHFQSFPWSVLSTVRSAALQNIPGFQSQMVTPEGESAALKVAWLIRIVLVFGLYRILKEKYEPRFKKRARGENKKVGKHNRRGAIVPIHTEIQSPQNHQQGAD